MAYMKEIYQPIPEPVFIKILKCRTHFDIIIYDINYTNDNV